MSKEYHSQTVEHSKKKKKKKEKGRRRLRDTSTLNFLILRKFKQYERTKNVTKWKYTSPTCND